MVLVSLIQRKKKVGSQRCDLYWLFIDLFISLYSLCSYLFHFYYSYFLFACLPKFYLYIGTMTLLFPPFFFPLFISSYFFYFCACSSLLFYFCFISFCFDLSSFDIFFFCRQVRLGQVRCLKYRYRYLHSFPFGK